MNKEERSNIIGGSDIAAVMGLHPYKTPLALWAEKTGKIHSELSHFEAAEIGTELEEYVSRKFTRKTGIKLRRDSRTFQHPFYPYMVAHIDRWVVGEDAVFEAKTCSAWLAKKWTGDDVPDEYVLQVNWYLGILKKRIGYIACLIGGQKFVWKMLEFDSNLFDKQVEEAKGFMENFILADMPPVAMQGDSETLLQMFPQSNEQTISFDGLEAETINGLIEDRLGALESISHTKEELEKIEAQIKQKLGPAEAGETSQYRFSWKTQQRKEYTVKASSFRVLTTKEK